MKALNRTLAVLLCTGMLFSMASCSSKDSYYRNAGAQWAIEAYKALPEEFNDETCDQFWIAGDVYRFPMRAEEFFDNGFKIIDIYKDDVNENYLLEPHYEYELCLNKDGEGMMTWIYNDSDEAKPVSDCMVVYIKINYYEEALLPGGALLDVRYKTLDEALAAFNKDMTVFDEEDYVYGYEYMVARWSEVCSVRINYSENPGDYSVGCVEYFALDPEVILG